MPIHDHFKNHQEIRLSSASTSLETLKRLYRLADDSLMELASHVDTSEKAQEIEDQLLEDKDRLILLAAGIKCKNWQEMSQKVDLLNIAFLEEKIASEFSPTDKLLNSIWEYCEIRI